MKGRNTNPTGKGGFSERRHQINRDGRPKDAASLAALARRISHEKATTKDGKPVLGPDGKPMTVAEVVMRQWAQDPKRQAMFIDRAFGKVPNSLDPQDVINWSPDEWRKEAARRQGEVADTLATLDDE